MDEPTYELTETKTRTVTVAEIYGKPFAELKAPEGYEFTLRMIRRGVDPDLAMAMNMFGSAAPLWDIHSDIHLGIRLELRKLPETERLVIEVPKGAKVHCFVETGEVRPPKRGEKFLYAPGMVCSASYDYQCDKYPILRSVEPKPC